MNPWWYLSFADDGFKGACFVRASGMLHAVSVAHQLKINPGGQVCGQPVPDDVVIEEQWQNKLLSKEDLQAMFPNETVMTQRERLERN